MADNITPLRIAILAKQSLFLEGIATKLKNYPGVIDAYYVSPNSTSVIDELTTISPAVILVDAGDMDSAQISIPNILDSIPNSKVYRFDLSSDHISIFTSESLNVSHVNELVDFMQATSIGNQST